MGKIYCFFHIFCASGTLNIIQDQITKIHFSGLYKTVDTIYCCLASHNQSNIDEVKEYISKAGSKFKILKTDSSNSSYERFTLHEMQNILQPDDKVLYIHSKGVTKQSSTDVYQWRTLMEYFLMVNHNQCISDLETYDCVGVNWHTEGAPPHFSGNFWWAHARHILRLPKEIGPSYNDPEFWIGLCSPNFKCYFESYVNHYYEPFTYDKYVDTN